MFIFKAKQSVFEIAGVKIGGQPGQLPTVMVGSIFYHGDKKVTNEKTGVFDKRQAEKILKNEEELSIKTGNPRIVDVCASWPEAIPKYIDFVANSITGPFSIDGTTAEVRIAGLKYVTETGLADRVVYNSISPHTKDEEITVIKEAKISTAILLALNTTNPTISGRLDVIGDLIKKVKTFGIEKMIIDTTVLDIPDPGPAGKTAFLLKDKYGLPTGCGAHNAIDIWQKRRTLNKETKTLCSVSANVLPIIMGANFLLYGPVKNASLIYMPVAVTNAYIAYAMMQEHNIRPMDKNHPLYRVFRK